LQRFRLLCTKLLISLLIISRLRGNGNNPAGKAAGFDDSGLFILEKPSLLTNALSVS